MDSRAELIGGVERREIVLVDSDPGWPARFEAESERIRAALGPIARRVEHVGSTAVAGLPAKPIIDLQVSVTDPEKEADFVRTLQQAGYSLRVRERDHRLLRSAALDVHVHVCAVDGAWERRHVLFRDWLRTDAADRSLYTQTKKALAAREWPSMNHYAAAKGAVIAEITMRAETWATRTGWPVEQKPLG